MYDLVLTSGTSACTASTYYDAALSDRSGAPYIYIYGSTARALAPDFRASIAKSDNMRPSLFRI